VLETANLLGLLKVDEMKARIAHKKDPQDKGKQLAASKAQAKLTAHKPARRSPHATHNASAPRAQHGRRRRAHRLND
jgi:hypothetical protein